MPVSSVSSGVPPGLGGGRNRSGCSDAKGMVCFPGRIRFGRSPSQSSSSYQFSIQLLKPGEMSPDHPRPSTPTAVHHCHGRKAPACHPGARTGWPSHTQGMHCPREYMYAGTDTRPGIVPLMILPLSQLYSVLPHQQHDRGQWNAYFHPDFPVHSTLSWLSHLTAPPVSRTDGQFRLKRKPLCGFSISFGHGKGQPQWVAKDPFFQC